MDNQLYNVQLSHAQLSLLKVLIINYKSAWAKDNATLPSHIVDLLDSTDYQLQCNNSPEVKESNSPTISKE